MKKIVVIALLSTGSLHCDPTLTPNQAHSTNNPYMPEVNNSTYIGPYPETYLPQQQKSVPVLNPAQKAQVAEKAKASASTQITDALNKLATNKQITEAISTITKVTTEQKPKKELPSAAKMPTDPYQQNIAIDYQTLTEQLIENFQKMRKDANFTNLLKPVIQRVYLDSLKAMKALDDNYVDAFQSYVSVFENMTNISINKQTGQVTFK